MIDDEVRIRRAQADDAEKLRDIAWSSMEYWDMDSEELNAFRSLLDIDPAVIEKDISYLAEDIETEETLGFFILETIDNEYWLRYLCVAPDYMGTGIGEQLFLNACEVAEETGAKEMQIVCHPNAAEFYTRMGAEYVCEYAVKTDTKDINFAQLKTLISRA